jgi:hypothetical protein
MGDRNRRGVDDPLARVQPILFLLSATRDARTRLSLTLIVIRLKLARCGNEVSQKYYAHAR